MLLQLHSDLGRVQFDVCVVLFWQKPVKVDLCTQTLQAKCGESVPYESYPDRAIVWSWPAVRPPGVSGPIAEGGGPACSVRLRTKARFANE